MARDFNTVINKFLGLNQCEAGESRLKKGESPKMKNLKVTPNYTLIQRDGWEKVSDTKGVGRGLYVGKDVVWIVSDRVYLKNADGEYVIGCLDTTEGDVCIFPFDSKLYFLDGKRIKSWDGISFSDIDPYVPLIAISCEPSGAGIPFEDVNLLTGKMRQSFTPDGTTNQFRLVYNGLTRVDSVKLHGKDVDKSKLSINEETGIVTIFDMPSDTTPNCLEIAFTKSTGTPELINRMRHAVSYGGDNDTRIFVWGDEEYPSHIRYSGVHDGMTGMNYFPELSFNRIGSGGKITSAVRHYDRLMVFTENEAFQCSPETKDDENGMLYTVYPIKTVSSEVGCAVEGFAKLIDNSPITLSTSGLYRWNSSSIRDERNANDIGERISRGLRELGTQKVRSFDRSSLSEFFIWRGNDVYVYNYALDVFYYYNGFGAAAFAEGDDGRMWFVREDGALCISSDTKKDDGQPMEFLWESGYEDHLGLDTKNIHSIDIELYPISSTGFSFIWVSEKLTGRYETLEVEYRVADFTNLCFDSLSFATAVTPVRLHKRIKAKRVRGFKLILKNESDKTDFHMLSLMVSGRTNDAK